MQAPKTDTPATQESSLRKALNANRLQEAWDELESSLVSARTGEDILARKLVKAQANIARRKEVSMKVTQMYQRLDKHCAELESTLAAERALRLQADTEQFNAGIEAAAKVTDEYRDRLSDPKLYWQYGPFRTTAEDLGRQIRKRSKPSVSPEQQTE